ncbi:hypothetical protein DPEC_G00026380 [Dallia pectoralis]|uniref:Uncharacterized protein n=1 Tax=Dallia pectoralis TaxID=75939 RepID=A0ACC2HHE5_DALPE|nr:hypothetical protein DPEC_G00026380 [Dallia pectoralis]
MSGNPAKAYFYEVGRSPPADTMPLCIILTKVERFRWLDHICPTSTDEGKREEVRLLTPAGTKPGSMGEPGKVHFWDGQAQENMSQAGNTKLTVRAFVTS